MGYYTNKSFKRQTSPSCDADTPPTTPAHAQASGQGPLSPSTSSLPSTSSPSTYNSPTFSSPGSGTANSSPPSTPVTDPNPVEYDTMPSKTSAQKRRAEDDLEEPVPKRNGAATAPVYETVDEPQQKPSIQERRGRSVRRHRSFSLRRHGPFATYRARSPPMTSRDGDQRDSGMSDAESMNAVNNNDSESKYTPISHDPANNTPSTPRAKDVDTPRASDAKEEAQTQSPSGPKLAAPFATPAPRAEAIIPDQLQPHSKSQLKNTKRKARWEAGRKDRKLKRREKPKVAKARKSAAKADIATAQVHPNRSTSKPSSGHEEQDNSEAANDERLPPTHFIDVSDHAKALFDQLELEARTYVSSEQSLSEGDGDYTTAVRDCIEELLDKRNIDVDRFGRPNGILNCTIGSVRKLLDRKWPSVFEFTIGVDLESMGGDVVHAPEGRSKSDNGKMPDPSASPFSFLNYICKYKHKLIPTYTRRFIVRTLMKECEGLDLDAPYVCSESRPLPYVDDLQEAVFSQDPNFLFVGTRISARKAGTDRYFRDRSESGQGYDQGLRQSLRELYEDNPDYFAELIREVLFLGLHPYDLFTQDSKWFEVCMTGTPMLDNKRIDDIHAVRAGCQVRSNDNCDTEITKLDPKVAGEVTGLGEEFLSTGSLFILQELVEEYFDCLSEELTDEVIRDDFEKTMLRAGIIFDDGEAYEDLNKFSDWLDDLAENKKGKADEEYEHVVKPMCTILDRMMELRYPRSVRWGFTRKLINRPRRGDPGLALEDDYDSDSDDHDLDMASENEASGAD